MPILSGCINYCNYTNNNVKQLYDNWLNETCLHQAKINWIFKEREKMLKKAGLNGYATDQVVLS